MPTQTEERRSNQSADLRKIGLNADFWYPVAIDKHLKRGKPLGVSFAGEPIVLVRTAGNRVYALEDRCAHRQMPLRHGEVRGERLRCCYHGWSYDETGRCEIPYLPDGVARPHGVRTYPLRRAHGLIFVFPGDPARADAVPLPELPSGDARDYVAIPFVREIDCHYSFMHENLMDMTHQVLHRRWMGELTSRLLAVRSGYDRVEVDYEFDFHGRNRALRNVLQALVGVRVSADGGTGERADFMTVATHYPYQSLQLRRPNRDEPSLALWVCYVPADRSQTTSRPCGLLLIRKPALAFLAHVMSPMFQYFTNAIFEEDRFALEAEQRAYDMQGADWNQEVLPFIIQLRKLLAESGTPIA